MASFEWPAKGSGGGGGGGGVTTVNLLSGNISLNAGTDITITDDGVNTITINSTGGGGAQFVQSVSDTNSIDLDVTTDNLTANLKLSSAAAAAGTIKAANSIQADGLRTQVPILVGDSGSGGAAGVAPAPGSGDAASGKYLKADATWETPPVGDTFPGTTKGDLYVYDGAATVRVGAGTNGYVLSSDSSTSSGVKWDAPAVSGANTALSNLTSTAINQDLLPSTDNTYNLGASGKLWKDVNATNVTATNFNGDTLTVRTINWTSNVIDFTSCRLINVLDPIGAQDAATKNYVDTRSSVGVFTGTAITGGAFQNQKLRYTGGSAQTLATFTISAIPDGGTLTVTGTSNTNRITIPAGIFNIVMNGDWVGNEYSVITFVKDDTQLIEVSRNGI